MEGAQNLLGEVVDLVIMVVRGMGSDCLVGRSLVGGASMVLLVVGLEVGDRRVRSGGQICVVAVAAGVEEEVDVVVVVGPFLPPFLRGVVVEGQWDRCYGVHSFALEGW